ncbi:VPLPA-CTERM sorting domain-containing protein [Pseudooceanicola sp.]|uniref:VPLPA-CTERM sorting domain-containing protein n=1 Tax=Pseudooceanicola sp. TaxID=1914328 RepID=UPI0035C77729
MTMKTLLAAASVAVATSATGALAVPVTIDFGGADGEFSELSYEGGLLTVSTLLGALGSEFSKVTRQAEGLGVTHDFDSSDELDNWETLFFSFNSNVKLIKMEFAAFNPGLWDFDNYVVTVLQPGPSFVLDIDNADPLMFGEIEANAFSIGAGVLDYFYIESLTFDDMSAVPLPAGGALLLGGLGGLAALRRKRKAA